MNESSDYLQKNQIAQNEEYDQEYEDYDDEKQ